MSSPPPSNILLDPVTELTAALRTNAFGIASSDLVLDGAFPITDEDKAGVASSSRRAGRTDGRVRARAMVRLKEGGEVEVVLDQRGYTVESTTSTTAKTFPHTTYETLESMLISLSPAYVEAMTQEVGRRFAGIEEGVEPGQGAVAGSGTGPGPDEQAGPDEQEGRAAVYHAEAALSGDLWKDQASQGLR